MIITKLALPRRTFLRGNRRNRRPAVSGCDGARTERPVESRAPRFAAVYIGNGANMAQWTPATDGVNFEMSPILKGIEEYRDRMAVFTGLDNFPGTDQGDVGGQHPRAAPAFMSGTHAKPTEGADLQAGTTIDQIIAAEDLPRHEASVVGNDGRSHRRRRRLRPRLRVRVHELHVVENSDHAAAVRDEPAVHFRADVRRGKHGGRAAAPRREDRSILDGVTRGDRRPSAASWARAIASSWASTSMPSAMSSSVSRRPSRPTATSPCRISPSAYPPRSRNISSCCSTCRCWRSRPTSRASAPP